MLEEIVFWAKNELGEEIVFWEERGFGRKLWFWAETGLEGGGICFEEYGFWVEHRRIGSFGGIGFGVKNGFSEQSVFFGRK